MVNKTHAFITITFRLLLVLLMFSVCRLIFIWHNADLYTIKGAEYWDIFAAGLRFDTATILYFYFPLVCFYFLAKIWVRQRWFYEAYDLAFITLSLILLTLSLTDVAYFRFTLRRSTNDLFDILGDTRDMFGIYAGEYWWLILVGLLLAAFFVYAYRRIMRMTWYWTGKAWASIAGLALYLMLFSWVSGRLSTPLTPASAPLYVPPNHVTLVTNTPFTILFSFVRERQPLEQKKYFQPDELKEKYSIYHQFEHGTFQPLNVMVIMLESFTYTLIDPKNPKRAKTPFLDSLRKKSLTFTNAHANGTSSAYGVNSVVGSIPPFIYKPYAGSGYSSNFIHGIGDILKDEGYQFRAFFQGCDEDSYGLKKTVALYGMDKAYNRADFGDKRFHDGGWGVFDEPFFQYSADVINESEKPFFTVLFNVTSHWPYRVPDSFAQQFPADELPMNKGISYVDYALEQFFKKIEQTDWYENTLFVLVADHVGAKIPYQQRTAANTHEIPLIFYHPGGQLMGKEDKVVQQVDIVPSVLDYLGYNKSFTSFGTSVFDTIQPRYWFTRFGDLYCIRDDNYFLQYDEKQEIALDMYAYKTDSLLQNDLIDSLPDDTERLTQQLRAVIQTHNMALMENKLIE